jgi:hypothetical protein
MNFALAILLYLIIFVVLLWSFSRCGMGIFSALTLTALIDAIVLMVFIPPSEIDDQIDVYFKDRPHKSCNDYIVLIYLLIMTLSLLLVSAYVIFKAFEDRERRVQTLGEDYNSDFRDYLSLW